MYLSLRFTVIIVICTIMLVVFSNTTNAQSPSIMPEEHSVLLPLQSTNTLWNDNGFLIRGSKPYGSKLVLDGYEIGNPFNNTLGVAGVEFPMISQYALQRVFITDSLKYQSIADVTESLVMFETKKGNPEKFDIMMRFGFEMPFLYGKSSDDLSIVHAQDRFNVIHGGDGLQLQSRGQNTLEFNISGNFVGIPDASFSAGMMSVSMDHYNAGLEVYDPAGNNLGRMKDQGLWKQNIYANINIPLSNTYDMRLGAYWGMTCWENSDWAWLYADSTGIIDGKKQ